MPSAANGKAEKTATSEADNTPVRQIMTIVEHKIRNLEKRKSKLTSYRDLQKAGTPLNADQKVAVAKYDEVVQTLEFARDLSKQITGVAVAAEKEAKKQAKKDAWVRYAAETNKIREVLLVLDCLMQMGTPEVREDFLNGANGAAKLTEQDLKILDDLYPEVTPKHDLNEEGQPGFHTYVTKAAEHLYSIIDGKPKDVLGTTYAHIKQIILSVHECGYFDKPLTVVEELQEVETVAEEVSEEMTGPAEEEYGPQCPAGLPVPPAAAVVPAPAYPLRPLPPITLQEVEHAYFAHQYPPPQRPIAEVIGSQNFFFLQESEIDSPTSTPQPPAIGRASPPAPIPTQTFTNQHYGRVVPEAALHYEPAPYGVPLPPGAVLHVPLLSPAPHPAHSAPEPSPIPAPQPTENYEDVKENSSPEREDADRNKSQGQGDGQNRFRRYGGGGGGGRGRGSSNGYRGRSYQNRQNSDSYHRNDYQGRSNNEGYGRKYNDNYQGRNKDGDSYQGRSKDNDNYQSRNKDSDGYQSRHKDNDNYQSRNKDNDNYQSRNKDNDNYQSRNRDNDNYQNRHKGDRDSDNYYGNGDTNNGQQYGENRGGGRDRYNDGQNYQGGFKTRGRGGSGRGGGRPRAAVFTRKPDSTAAAE